MPSTARVTALAALTMMALLSGCDDDENRLVQPRGEPPLLVVNDSRYGIEPFRFDPVSGDIELLIDANTDTPGSSPGPGVVIGAEALFAADDGLHGQELWASDGTTTRQVAELCPGNCGEILQILANGSQAFIVARGPGDGEALWVSDGTSAGTHLLRAEQDAEDGYHLLMIGAVGGDILFADSNADGNVTLLRSDGSAAGTTAFRRITATEAYMQRVSTGVALAGKVWFAIEDQLWSSDLSDAGTALLPVTVFDAIAPVLLNGKVYVAGSGAAASVVAVPATRPMQVSGPTLCYWSGGILHVTDGTVDGSRIALTGGGWEAPDGTALAASAGCYFLTPNDSAHNSWTLWLARPSQPDNIVVHIFSTRLQQESLKTLGSVGGKLFFPVRPLNGTGASQLWYVEGADATHLADMRATRGIATLGNTLLFVGDGEPWRSDGTVAGTRLIADLNQSSTLHGWPDRALRINGKTYFQAISGDGNAGADVFTTDGTSAGTLAMPQHVSLETLRRPTTPQGQVYVEHAAGVQEFRLAIAASTDSRLLDSVCRDEFARQPAFASGDGFVLAVVVACGEVVLWKTDGTVAGTTRAVLANVAEFSPDSYPADDLIATRLELWPTPTRFYLSVCFSSSRCEIRVTDGTLAGTTLLGETAQFNFTTGVVLGEALYLAGGVGTGLQIATHNPAQFGNAGEDLLPAGAHVYSARPLGSNQMILSVTSDGSADSAVGPGLQLWRSDGTTAGTQLLVDVGARAIVDWAPAGERIFFTTVPSNDPGVVPSTGELWSTDGTPAGTVELTNAVVTTGSVDSYLDCGSGNIVIDLYLPSAFPKLYANAGEAWFLRKGPRSGINLWFSNGTVAGTRRMTKVPDYNCGISGLL